MLKTAYDKIFVIPLKIISAIHVLIISTYVQLYTGQTDVAKDKVKKYQRENYMETLLQLQTQVDSKTKKNTTNVYIVV